MHRSLRVGLVSAAALAVAGCVGSVGPEAGEPGGTTPRSPGASTGMPPAGTPTFGPPPVAPSPMEVIVPPRPDAPAACRTPRPGPSPLRRLTRFEYDNTI